MEDRGFEATFPLVFYDGNTTMPLGDIFIHPSLSFKEFQSIISHKIGLSPNQITSYYERGPLPSRSGKYCAGNRRSPVTSKFNFASILFDNNCLFFVVLKRSRRERHRNKKQSFSNYPVYDELSSLNPNFYAISYSNYQAAYNYQMEVERYMMSRDLNSVVYSHLELQSRLRMGSNMTGSDGASSSGGVSSSGGFCDVCANAKREGQTASFHLCKSDAIVTTWFYSSFGPIARPIKEQ